ncbi:unnamed protein product, partial [Closterium sp. NIES-54]
MDRKKLRQIDVANAFLYAPVDAEIFVEHPHGCNADPNQVCQLQKSLYGIKQAPILWQQHLHARLIRIGFCQLPHDQGMYQLTKGTNYILLIVYADDLLYIGSTDDITTWFEGELQRDLTLTIATTVTQYLGLNIQDGDNAIYLSAEKYMDTIAKRFELTPATITTPYRYTDGNRKVSTLLKPAGIRDYQRKLGCLLFAAVTCRLDLSYSASQLATYLKKPEAEHMMELDRALHYLVSTPTIELTYHKTGTTTPKLIGYVDADRAGDSYNRRSRTGYINQLEPIGPISWQSNKQELIALSSAKAEYIALSRAWPCRPLSSTVTPAPATAATTTTTAATATPTYCTAMSSLRVLAFDHEGGPVQFDTWLDDLQLYLLSDSTDSVSLFDLVSGATTAPPATAD